MRKIIIVLLTLLFLSCSSDDSTPARRITFKVNGVSKVFEDIRVQSNEDLNFEVPFYRLDISAEPKNGDPETFALRVIRGGELDGQSTNGGAYLDGSGYHYNFEHPIQMHLTINTNKRIKGTFEGIFTDTNGYDVQITEGKIDITYYPDNPQYIKR
ncbi:MAG: hypothetical protein ABIQ27_04665 [Flavobacterium sp.]|uniref:hypothetical protein n=1 Tax=Flavobacterium sp. TaxID=239 RepID=UPI003264A5F8